MRVPQPPKILDRQRLFLTDEMHTRLDAPARANISRAIERLAELAPSKQLNVGENS